MTASILRRIAGPAFTAVLAFVWAPVAPDATPLSGQIQRNPTGVNVNANGATTVFITFGNLEGYVPVEAIW